MYTPIATPVLDIPTLIVTITAIGVLGTVGLCVHASDRRVHPQDQTILSHTHWSNSNYSTSVSVSSVIRE